MTKNRLAGIPKRKAGAIGRALTSILLVVIIASVALGLGYQQITTGSGSSSLTSGSTTIPSSFFTNSTNPTTATRYSSYVECFPASSSATMQENATSVVTSTIICYAPTSSVSYPQPSYVSVSSNTTVTFVSSSSVSCGVVTGYFGGPGTNTAASTSIMCSGMLTINEILVTQFNCTAYNFTAIVTGGGPPYNYNWNFGDGTNLNTNDSSVAHDYHSPGSYLLSLQVMDTPHETYSEVGANLMIVVPSSGC